PYISLAKTVAPLTCAASNRSPNSSALKRAASFGMCRDVWYSTWTFRHGTGRQAAMLGSIQNFFATPPASGIADDPASFGVPAWPRTPVASHAPTLDPTADCKKRRRFARCAIRYIPAGMLCKRSGLARGGSSWRGAPQAGSADDAGLHNRYVG